MASASDRFTIEAGRWYALHMLPGYVEDGLFCPYVSPVYVEQVRAKSTASGLFELTLVNAAYAEGVQRFEMTLKILKRAQGYVFGEIAGEPQRAAILGEIGFEWLEKHFTTWWTTAPADRMPEPFRSDVQQYLERRLGLLHG